MMMLCFCVIILRVQKPGKKETDGAKSLSGWVSTLFIFVLLARSDFMQSNLLALAVYSRSPTTYQALRGFKLLQLPCVCTLKYYIDSNLEGAGDSMERLQQCRVQYNALIEEKKKILEENSNKGDNFSVC